MKTSHALFVVLSTTPLAALSGVAFAQALQKPSVAAGPLPNTDSDEIRAAVAQGERLLSILRGNGWEYPCRIPREIMRLPGQSSAEYPQDRGLETMSFRIARLDQDSEVAFFTDLYARDNLERLPGGKAALHPSGFYIVGYRDGHVATVPVGQARRFDLPPEKERPEMKRSRLAFPGTQNYREADKGAPRN